MPTGIIATGLARMRAWTAVALAAGLLGGCSTRDAGGPDVVVTGVTVLTARESTRTISNLFWSLSLEVFIMCLLGGWFIFLGPLFGAAAIVTLRIFGSTYTDYWSAILGVIMMLTILFLPDGILGLFQKKAQKAEE